VCVCVRVCVCVCVCGGHRDVHSVSQADLKASVRSLLAERDAMEHDMIYVVTAERDRILEEARVLNLKERLAFEKHKPRCCGAYF
jgi:hypothetical protein